MSGLLTPERRETMLGNAQILEVFNITKIGKVASSHLRLEDDVASRMHAMIEVTGPNEVYIIDLGSAAGTFVNGQKTNKARLSTGDEIVIGHASHGR